MAHVEPALDVDGRMPLGAQKRARLNNRRAYLDRTVSLLKDSVIPGIYDGVVGVTSGSRATSSLVEKPHGARERSVNDLAAQGQPRVITAGGQFKVQWDRMSVPGYAASGDNYAPRLFAALFPDKVYELLVSQIGDLPGISANERADRVRELEVRIMLLEHQEESLVAQALAQGLAGVFRRSDASPYALLSCSPGALAAKKEEPAMEMA